jgi:succinate dehydrogenase / fumarate reductase flavoprotein subunit
MQLANPDITKEPMEVADDAHIMGGVRGRAKRRCPACGGFAAGEVAAGLHGANRLGGNSLSDLCSASARARLAAKFAKEPGGAIDWAQIEQAAREGVEPFDRAAVAGKSYQVQIDFQEMMQDLVGIVRGEEMVRALAGLGKLWERSKKVAVYGHPNTTPGGTPPST